MARRTSSASARVTPAVSATIRSTCSWKTTTPAVSRSAGTRVSCRWSGSDQPCLARRKGVIMSDLTGPGRNSEMSMMMSSKLSGPNLPMSSRCPGDSIWKQPRVWVLRIRRKVASSSSGT